MIEILRTPIIITGEPLSRANINLDYRLKNVPVHKIQNKQLRAKKFRWDQTNVYKDLIRYELYNVKTNNKIQTIRLPYMVFVHILFVFSFKKSRNPAELRKDLDNCEKLTWDAVEASTLIENDSQICHKIVHKAVSKDRPRIEIYSICSSLENSDVSKWIRGRGSFLSTHPIYKLGDIPV